MENFVVSARKYRPSSFDTVVGQQAITTTLKNAIKHGHLAQAFLFCGPRGVGKTTCARILAKTINCENVNTETEACNECISCVSFDDARSLNIYELDAASNNSVDDIRSLIDQVRFAPQSGNYKVYIIDEVHMLSAAAFNAFLKTLEEPPSHAIFILATTEKHKIIPTILSRCQIFDFNRISVKDIARHLQYIAEKEGVATETDALHIIGQKADGALRDALSMFDQLVNFTGGNLTYESVIQNLNVLDYDYYFKLTDNLLSNDIPSSLLIFDEILNNGFDGHNFINGLAEHFRNLLVCKDATTLQLLEVGENIKTKYAEQSQKCEQHFLLNALDLASKCDINYKSSKNQRLLVELTLMQLSSLTVSSEKKTVEQPKIIATKQEAKKIEEKEAEPTKVEEPIEKIQNPKSLPLPNEALLRQTDEIRNKETEQKEEPETRTEYSAPSIQRSVSSNQKPLLKTNTLSISSVFKEEGETKEGKREESSGISNESELNNEFTEEQFKSAWKDYALKVKRQGKESLFNILSKEPIVKEDNTVEVTLDNKALEDEFNNEKADLLACLRAELGNNNIRLTYNITKTETLKKLYTNRDKYLRMAEKNPNLQKLRERLDLDIDY